MSTLKVANIHFEATGTNRVEYVANNINFRTGGGNFTISVGGAESLNVNASSVMISGANILASVAAAATTANNAVQTTRNVSAGGIATGGGDLSADRTITVTKATGAEVTTGTDDTHATTPKAIKDAGLIVANFATAAQGTKADSALQSIPLLHVREEQSNGVDPQILTGSGTFDKRILNTVVTNTVSGASLASSQITLPAGTYDVQGYVPAIISNRHRARLQNITDSSTVILGKNTMSGGGVSEQTESIITGRITIAGTKVFEIQHAAQTSSYGGSAGVIYAGGGTEVYTSIEFRKVA